jgi:hypothetical protein
MHQRHSRYIGMVRSEIAGNFRLTLQQFATARIRTYALPALALAFTMGGCSSDAAMWNADWAWWRSKPPTTASMRPVGADAYVGPDGTCATAESDPVSRGIGLGMSECDLIRLAGPTDKIDIATNERGERTAVITYAQGERAGIYRFTSGQLTTMDRVDEPPPPPKQQRRKPAPKPPAARPS